MKLISPIFIILLFWLKCIIVINSIGSYTNSFPHFYHLGEATRPTKGILNNLTYYRNEWRSIQTQDGFYQTYAFTMAWDCSPCDECFQANKFIKVENNTIIGNIETSLLNDDSKKMACFNTNKTKEKSEYKTIDELYDMLVAWVKAGVDGVNSDYLIIELMLHKTYFFPMAVKLSEKKDYIAWDISCFEPGRVYQEEDVCEYSTTSNQDQDKLDFWITKEMQSFLGWSMIFLILVACSLGYCINWLKKKKSEKIEAWREKEEKQREERIERERQKADKRRHKKEKNKKGRKGSKSKHRAHLEKSKRSRNSSRNSSKSDYSNVPIVSNMDHSTDSDQSDHHYDIQEEQKHDEDR